MRIRINKIRTQSGFSLIELLIASGMALTIFLAVAMFLNTQRKTYNTQQSKAEAQEAVERVHGELLDKIRVSGYMIPSDVYTIVPYHVADGPDSIKVTGNYENYYAPARKPVAIHTSKIEVTKVSTPRYREGMRVMIRKTVGDTIFTCWSTVDTLKEKAEHFEFWVGDTSNIVYDFPESSRVSTFNSYTYKVVDPGGDDPPYFAVRINAQDTLYRLVNGIEDITLTYETKNDTTERDSLSTDSLEYIYAVNLTVQARSLTADRMHIDSLYGDNFWRATLTSQIVVLNLAIDRR